MKHFFTLTLCFLTLSLTAQIDNFPFNPDSNSDGFISVDDLMAMLSNYGEPFELPDYTEWSTGTMSNLLEYNEELEAFQDSLSDAWLELSSTQSEIDSVLSDIEATITDSILQHVKQTCRYNPHYGNIDARYLEEGCNTAMLYAYDYNEYGGTLRLTADGRDVGDLVTIVYAGKNGNAGSWSIESTSSGGYVNIDNVNPYGGANWLGGYPIWVKTYSFDGEGWSEE